MPPLDSRQETHLWGVLNVFLLGLVLRCADFIALSISFAPPDACPDLVTLLDGLRILIFDVGRHVDSYLGLER